MDGCCEGYCRKCRGMVWGLIGVVMLINLFVWPHWLGLDGWVGFLAVLLIVGGLWRSAMPHCGCHAEYKAEAPKEAKKKK